MDLQTAIGSNLADARRSMEVFRKGVVTLVDKTVTPWLATVAGRPMPFFDEGIAVGDVVFYIDQPDPFAWSRLGADGLFVDPYKASISATYVLFDEPSHFLPAIERVHRSGFEFWTGGIRFTAWAKHPSDSGSLTSFDLEYPYKLGSPLGDLVSPLVAPTDVVYEYQNVSGMTLVTSGNIGANNLPGAKPAFSPAATAGTLNMGYNGVVHSAASIVSKSIATGTIQPLAGVPYSFPSVSAPGKDHLMLFVLQARPHDAAVPLANLDYTIGPDSSPTRPYMYNFGFSNTWGLISDRGELNILYWRSSGAGSYAPTVTFDADIDADLLLSSFLCEARET